jgi:hypothetical protein
MCIIASAPPCMITSAPLCMYYHFCATLYVLSRLRHSVCIITSAPLCMYYHVCATMYYHVCATLYIVWKPLHLLKFLNWYSYQIFIVFSFTIFFFKYNILRKVYCINCYSVFCGKWIPVTTAWRVLGLRMEERPPMWVGANILNKQSRTANKVWSSSLGVGRSSNNSSP